MGAGLGPRHQVIILEWDDYMNPYLDQSTFVRVILGQLILNHSSKSATLPHYIMG